MKILVIDNGTNYKKKLARLLDGHDITTIEHVDINKDTLKYGPDLVVLTGADGGHSVKYYADKLFIAEQELIKQAKVPVIGLCFGAQLIAHIYGAKLSTVPGRQRRIKGIKRIYNVTQTPFDFFRYYGGRVWASQRWRITDLPKSLESWCASNEGIEVFKHATKPIYGLQFHPERRAEQNDGKKIFITILDLAL